MRTAATAFALLGLICLIAPPAFSQTGNAADEIGKGHYLAVRVCSICHIAAPDQAAKPMLNPPGPPFQSIAQRPGLTADALEKFITTAHRGLDNPKGMPNPDLAAYQVKQVAAYIMSLRK
ncbi:MAG TPA: c-type cytochrome [Xanthobacteraceae bacterium]|nr:c-type cytochrome [Xanthobacteraceae bacterium]